MPALEPLHSSLRHLRGFAIQSAQPWPTHIKLLKHEKVGMPDLLIKCSSPPPKPYTNNTVRRP